MYNTAKLYIEIIVWLTSVLCEEKRHSPSKDGMGSMPKMPKNNTVFVHEDVPCMKMVVKMAILIMTASIAALCLKTDPNVFLRYGCLKTDL